MVTLLLNIDKKKNDQQQLIMQISAIMNASCNVAI